MLKEKAEIWQDLPLLARTHGQPASPTRMGKRDSSFCRKIRKTNKFIKFYSI